MSSKKTKRTDPEPAPHTNINDSAEDHELDHEEPKIKRQRVSKKQKEAAAEAAAEAELESVDISLTASQVLKLYNAFTVITTTLGSLLPAHIIQELHHNNEDHSSDKAKKVKKVRDPDAPKRPPTGYQLFLTEFTKTLTEGENGKLSLTWMTDVAKAWNQMTDAEKQVYNSRVEPMKQRYADEMEVLKNKSKAAQKDAHSENEDSEGEHSGHGNDEEEDEEEEEEAPPPPPVKKSKASAKSAAQPVIEEPKQQKKGAAKSAKANVDLAPSSPSGKEMTSSQPKTPISNGFLSKSNNANTSAKKTPNGGTPSSAPTSEKKTKTVTKLVKVKKDKKKAAADE
ncbi:high mobility group box 3 [Chytriomyces hyalinus]|nr:high mobility group box 3 [Chytriomyces hyalinus]